MLRSQAKCKHEYYFYKYTSLLTACLKINGGKTVVTVYIFISCKVILKTAYTALLN